MLLVGDCFIEPKIKNIFLRSNQFYCKDKFIFVNLEL